MKLLVTGATGLIGSAVVRFFSAAGHEVVRLVRRPSPQGTHDIVWNPEVGSLDPKTIEGFDVVIHLAGEPIASGRWTTEKKARILESRVEGTRLLVSSLTQLTHPPKIFLSASAVGFYGNRGRELLTEESPSGTGFLAEVCREWEEAARIAMAKEIRVVSLRFGMVLSREGGALRKMLPLFQWGLGGVMGNGRQYMSWIAIEDLVRAIDHIIQDETLQGMVNTLSPQPVTNREFTKTLGHLLKRPTLFRMPAFVLRPLFGEMAKELFLYSARALPTKLLASGFRFRYPDLEMTLRQLIS